MDTPSNYGADQYSPSAHCALISPTTLYPSFGLSATNHLQVARTLPVKDCCVGTYWAPAVWEASLLMQIMQIGDAVNTVIMQMHFFRNADRAHGVSLFAALPSCPI